MKDEIKGWRFRVLGRGLRARVRFRDWNRARDWDRERQDTRQERLDKLDSARQHKPQDNIT